MNVARVPFAIDGGWPVAIRDRTVIAREAGITLGGLFLSESSWAVMRGAGILSARIDQDTATRPVSVPDSALVDDIAFNNWTESRHGALGRLLLWDARESWWMANDPDLEVLLICSDPRMFPDEFADDVEGAMDWMSKGALGEQAPREAERLALLYGLPRAGRQTD